MMAGKVDTNARHKRHTHFSGRHMAMQDATITFAEQATLPPRQTPVTRSGTRLPLVIGHPAVDGPAWGWASRLAAGKDGLFASPSQLDPAFAKLVRAGRFKKVSASFYAPDNPNNFVPGVYYLRHVGFLGAQPPAVKGLAPVNFALCSAPLHPWYFIDWGASAAHMGSLNVKYISL